MADVRFTTGRRSREPGVPVGVRLNTFGLSKLAVELDGVELAPIITEAAQPALLEAKAEWPVLTGASNDSIMLVEAEIGPTFARVALQAGGEMLMADPRNPSGKDYAPFIEFNGSPTGRGRNTLSNAVMGNYQQIRDDIHAGVAALIERILA